jgi:N utilization substance protein A
LARENLDLLGALAELEAERGIDRETLLEAVEAALISAYRRNYGTGENVGVRIDRGTGQIDVYVSRTVVEEVTEPDLEIALDEARGLDPAYHAGDVIEFPVTPRDFGRIAAQTAKQVVVQRIREAERGMIYDEFAQREDDVVTGVVQRVQGRNVFVDLGKTEAYLPPAEQIQGERLDPGDRIKVYVVEVKKTTKGPQVLISRTHPGLLKRLFELEVPEIHDGLVEVKGIAREAGARSKLAVFSRDENVDPVGACVGHKGMRVQTVVNELRGEKVDIVRWSPDPEAYVANALSPSKVSRVLISPEEKVARVVVPDYQLSLAIGRAGQNARLAAKLTGWRIDIRSESQLAEESGEPLTVTPSHLAPWAGSLAPAPERSPVLAPWVVADVPSGDSMGTDGGAGTLNAPAASAPAEAEVEPAAPAAEEGSRVPAAAAAAPTSARRRLLRQRVERQSKPKAAPKPRKESRAAAGRDLLAALAEAGLLDNGADAEDASHSQDERASGGSAAAGAAAAGEPAAAPGDPEPAPAPVEEEGDTARLLEEGEALESRLGRARRTRKPSKPEASKED